jgi:hypothetical protein
MYIYIYIYIYICIYVYVPFSEGDCSSSLLLSLREKDLESELASVIEGYQPGDLWSLARRTAMEASRRTAVEASRRTVMEASRRNAVEGSRRTAVEAMRRGRKGLNMIQDIENSDNGIQGNARYTTLEVAIRSSKEFCIYLYLLYIYVYRYVYICI